MSFIDFACSNLFVSFIIASGLYAFIAYKDDYEWTDYCFKSLAFILFVPVVCMFSLIPALHLLIMIPVAFNFYGGVILLSILIQRIMIELQNAFYKHGVNERYAYAVNHDECDADMVVNNAIDSKEDSIDYSERIIN